MTPIQAAPGIKVLAPKRAGGDYQVAVDTLHGSPVTFAVRVVPTGPSDGQRPALFARSDFPRIGRLAAASVHLMAHEAEVIRAIEAAQQPVPAEAGA